MSKKEAAIFYRIVMGTLVLNSMPFYVLFDSGATHSFVSTRSVLLFDLEYAKIEANYRIKLTQ